MRRDTLLLALVIAVAIAVRYAAAALLQQPLADDGLSYFTMAEGLVERGEWRDAFGQQGFFSAGYPLLLAPFFAAFGASMATVLGVNLLLGGLSTLLVHRLAWLLARREDAALLAAAAFALWLPAIWNATFVGKENLSTPLLLGIAIAALGIARGPAPLRTAVVAGLLWGGSLLTGGSSLLLCAGVGVALLLLWRERSSIRPALAGGIAFVAAAMLVLTPWLIATDQMLGRPMLTTNAAFNLYIGNNPAANGAFVSVRETPLGPDWHRLHDELGEAELAALVQREALDWIAANPARAAELALLKLGYFWEPNLPDARDFADDPLVSRIRAIEATQYLAILALGLWAFFGTRLRREDRWMLGAMLLGFWAVHALAYIIPRYRDPAVPLLIAMGATQLAIWWAGRRRPAEALHAA